MNFIYKSKVSFWLRMAIASALSKNLTETTVKKKIKAYTHKYKENERENNIWKLEWWWTNGNTFSRLKSLKFKLTTKNADKQPELHWGPKKASNISNITCMVVGMRMELKTEGSDGSLLQNRLNASSDLSIPLPVVGQLPFFPQQKTGDFISIEYDGGSRLEAKVSCWKHHD